MAKLRKTLNIKKNNIIQNANIYSTKNELEDNEFLKYKIKENNRDMDGYVAIGDPNSKYATNKRITKDGKTYAVLTKPDDQPYNRLTIIFDSVNNHTFNIAKFLKDNYQVTDEEIISKNYKVRSRIIGGHHAPIISKANRSLYAYENNESALSIYLHNPPLFKVTGKNSSFNENNKCPLNGSESYISFIDSSSNQKTTIAANGGRYYGRREIEQEFENRQELKLGESFVKNKRKLTDQELDKDSDNFKIAVENNTTLSNITLEYSGEDFTNKSIFGEFNFSAYDMMISMYNNDLSVENKSRISDAFTKSWNPFYFYDDRINKDYFKGKYLDTFPLDKDKNKDSIFKNNTIDEVKSYINNATNWYDTVKFYSIDKNEKLFYDDALDYRNLIFGTLSYTDYFNIQYMSTLFKNILYLQRFKIKNSPYPFNDLVAGSPIPTHLLFRYIETIINILKENRVYTGFGYDLHKFDETVDTNKIKRFDEMSNKTNKALHDQIRDILPSGTSRNNDWHILYPNITTESNPNFVTPEYKETNFIYLSEIKDYTVNITAGVAGQPMLFDINLETPGKAFYTLNTLKELLSKNLSEDELNKIDFDQVTQTFFNMSCGYVILDIVSDDNRKPQISSDINIKYDKDNTGKILDLGFAPSYTAYSAIYNIEKDVKKISPFSDPLYTNFYFKDKVLKTTTNTTSNTSFASEDNYIYKVEKNTTTISGISNNNAIDSKLFTNINSPTSTSYIYGYDKSYFYLDDTPRYRTISYKYNINTSFDAVGYPKEYRKNNYFVNFVINQKNIINTDGGYIYIGSYYLNNMTDNKIKVSLNPTDDVILIDIIDNDKYLLNSNYMVKNGEFYFKNDNLKFNNLRKSFASSNYPAIKFIGNDKFLYDYTESYDYFYYDYTKFVEYNKSEKRLVINDSIRKDQIVSLNSNIINSIEVKNTKLKAIVSEDKSVIDFEDALDNVDSLFLSEFNPFLFYGDPGNKKYYTSLTYDRMKFKPLWKLSEDHKRKITINGATSDNRFVTKFTSNGLSTGVTTFKNSPGGGQNKKISFPIDQFDKNWWSFDKTKAEPTKLIYSDSDRFGYNTAFTYVSENNTYVKNFYTVMNSPVKIGLESVYKNNSFSELSGSLLLKDNVDISISKKLTVINNSANEFYYNNLFINSFDDLEKYKINVENGDKNFTLTPNGINIIINNKNKFNPKYYDSNVFISSPYVDLFDENVGDMYLRYIFSDNKDDKPKFIFNPRAIEKSLTKNELDSGTFIIKHNNWETLHRSSRYEIINHGKKFALNPLDSKIKLNRDSLNYKIQLANKNNTIPIYHEMFIFKPINKFAEFCYFEHSYNYYAINTTLFDYFTLYSFKNDEIKHYKAGNTWYNSSLDTEDTEYFLRKSFGYRANAITVDANYSFKFSGLNSLWDKPYLNKSTLDLIKSNGLNLFDIFFIIVNNNKDKINTNNGYITNLNLVNLNYDSRSKYIISYPIPKDTGNNTKQQGIGALPFDNSSGRLLINNGKVAVSFVNKELNKINFDKFKSLYTKQAENTFNYIMRKIVRPIFENDSKLTQEFNNITPILFNSETSFAQKVEEIKRLSEKDKKNLLTFLLRGVDWHFKPYMSKDIKLSKYFDIFNRSVDLIKGTLLSYRPEYQNSSTNSYKFDMSKTGDTLKFTDNRRDFMNLKMNISDIFRLLEDPDMIINDFDHITGRFIKAEHTRFLEVPEETVDYKHFCFYSQSDDQDNHSDHWIMADGAGNCIKVASDSSCNRFDGKIMTPMLWNERNFDFIPSLRLKVNKLRIHTPNRTYDPSNYSYKGTVDTITKQQIEYLDQGNGIVEAITEYISESIDHFFEFYFAHLSSYALNVSIKDVIEETNLNEEQYLDKSHKGIITEQITPQRLNEIRYTPLLSDDVDPYGRSFFMNMDKS